ncbi:hypothetical protein HRS00_07435 [Agrobacterium vaccinii]|nr:hypothetical protein HRS00_07435 [Agrobacterium vaccinii]
MKITMIKSFLATTFLAASLCAAQAQTQAPGIDALPVSTIFVASSGMWEQDAQAQGENKSAGSAEPTRGYYKVIAMRQTDGTAKIYLQQIAYTATGPSLVETVELEEFTQMKAYVTDIRPESSTGASDVPGLFVTVHLKTNPTQKDADAWTVLIDELGDMKIEKASN